MEGQKGLQLSSCPCPRWSGSDKVFSLECKPLLRRIEGLGHISKGLSPPSPCWKHKWDFRRENSWKCGTLLEMGHPGDFHLKLAHTQPPAISQLLLRSSCPLLASAASGLCKLGLCICLSVSQVSGEAVCPGTSIPWRIWEEMLIFSLFRFFLVVRMRMMSSKLYMLERKLEVLQYILKSSCNVFYCQLLEASWKIQIKGTNDFLCKQSA